MQLPKIDKIEVYRHVLNFKQPAGTSRGVYLTRKLWFVALGNSRFTAYGECAPLPDLSCDAMDDSAYEQKLKEVCTSLYELAQQSDAYETKLTKAEQLKCILHESIEQQVQDYPSMRFALESAVLQLRTESLVFSDTPFTQGLGMPINGLVWMGQIHEMAERMQQKLEQGFRCIKLKIGALDFEQELSLIEQLRQRFSPEQIEIRVDANGAFAVSEARSKLERLAKLHLHSIEQPIRAGQWQQLRQLCKETPLPIALDEELIGINDRTRKIELLETVRPQYIILKPSLHGGLTGALEWIELARERHIPSWITSALESNLGLCAIAQFAGLLRPDMPQGLGTGKLFTNNLDLPLEIRADQLFMDSTALENTILPMTSYLSSNQAPCVFSLGKD